MIKTVHTDAAPPPFSNYSQAVEVPEGMRLVYVSGQVGANTDGSFSDDEGEQHAQTWRNILAILEASGMGPQNVVEATGYVTRPSGVPLFRTHRDEALDGHRPASTLLVISGLASHEWLVEISVVAAG